MTVGDTYLESEGNSIQVAITATVTASSVGFIAGFVGIFQEDGVSGDIVALNIDLCEYQFEVPAALDVDAGDVVYIDTAQVTGHTPDAAGYATSAGAGLVALFKATSDKDANDIVTGILLSKGL